eukprot:2313598-Amphidinium_carterae.1
MFVPKAKAVFCQFSSLEAASTVLYFCDAEYLLDCEPPLLNQFKAYLGSLSELRNAIPKFCP